MNRAAFLHREPANQAKGSPYYLGPATVTRADLAEVEANLTDGRSALVRVALAYPYEPAVGDNVLVIGDEGGYYMIGVLQGSGRTRLELQGDVDVRATGGVLRLAGEKGVEIEGPEVSVRAGALRTIADSIVEACSSLRRRVTDLLSVHAGERHSIVDGASYEQSKSAAIVTEEKVTINGKQIYLG